MPIIMKCGICGKLAVWVCQCVGIRLCEDCFDVHCEENTAFEHQIVPIEEGETYTVEELRQQPALVVAKVEEELQRLEGFRGNVLGMVQGLGEIEDVSTVSRWVEGWGSWAEEQKAGIEEKVALVRSARLLEPLPRQDWDYGDILTLPVAMLRADLSLDTAIKATITWNLSCHAGNKARKYESNEESKQISPVSAPSQASTKQKALISGLQFPRDPATLFKALKSNLTQRLAYFRGKLNSDSQWPLRCFFEDNGELADLSSISLQGLEPKDEGAIAELALVLMTSAKVKLLRLTKSSIHSEEFEWICEGIRSSALEGLELGACKLANSHIAQLLPALPSSLEYLDLSQNYFDLSQLPATLLQSLQTLALHGLPNSNSWLQATTLLYPHLRLLA